MVVTAPAVIRRDGSVLADGWLPHFAWLGEASVADRSGGSDAAYSEPDPPIRLRAMSLSRCEPG
jgi:hypothetical protein